MIANYHTHTWRCNHASGSEEAYVECALQRGLKILGFSDHTPYTFPNGYDSWFRMHPDQLGDYCNTVRKLRDQYCGRIEIPLGLELEFYPALLPQQLPVILDQGIEYLLLGQHFIGNEAGEPYCGDPTSDLSILKRYCAQTADAMQTGLFTYFAHPDLLCYTGSDRDYREQMRLICREAKSCGIPLEINLLGYFKKRNYPDQRFWELAAEEGCSVILGCDTHDPKHLLETDTERRALEMVEALGLTLLETVELKSIG